jgi:hypothetical protein
MSTVGPPLTFNDKQVVVHFDPSIRDAHIVSGGIRQLVRRFQNLHRSQHDLVAAIVRYIGDYCLAARLVCCTSNVIEFSVTLRTPCPHDSPERPASRAAPPVGVASVLG